MFMDDKEVFRVACVKNGEVEFIEIRGYMSTCKNWGIHDDLGSKLGFRVSALCNGFCFPLLFKTKEQAGEFVLELQKLFDGATVTEFVLTQDQSTMKLLGGLANKWRKELCQD